MQIRTKLIVNAAVSIAFLLIIAAVGYYGISGVTAALKDFAGWADIDMVMNEAVTQKILLAKIAFSDYRRQPDSPNFDRLQKAWQEAAKGVEEWRGMLERKPELLKVAEAVDASLKNMAAANRQYREYVEKAGKILSDGDEAVSGWLQMLDDTMEKVIDPQKEAFAREGDLENTIKWSRIDMVMNEEVIAAALHLQTAFHDYVRQGSEQDPGQLEKAIVSVQEGLKSWGEVITGEAGLEKAAGEAGLFGQYQAVDGGQARGLPRPCRT